MTRANESADLIRLPGAGLIPDHEEVIIYHQWLQQEIGRSLPLRLGNCLHQNPPLQRADLE